MSAQRPVVSDLRLEKLLLGELDADDEKGLRAAMDADEALRQRYQELEASNAAILASYPPQTMALRIMQKAGQAAGVDSARRMSILWPALVSVPIAAAIALLLVVGPNGAPGSSTEVGLEPTRVKGDTGPALFVFRQAGGAEELLVEGQSATKGDVLQLRYAGRGMKYGLIFSLDGLGKVTRHMPVRGPYSQALEKSGVSTLPMAFALDDAPIMERFYFVAAMERFSVDKVLESAEDLAAGVRKTLDLPVGAVAVTFTVTKR
ncbi:MAG: hypothetical protein MUC50_04890 [Myxococcota bacterium]|jgi:hypothetical protein|nr:hypothetical protein [Myxococcota bacterium]